jgi:GNAT superfamily N-acetyltransferase
MSNPIEVRLISAAETLPLRQSVLRPGRSVEAAQFPGDDAPTTRHFGAFRDGRLLGIASLFLAEMPEQPGMRALQLRGMATAPEVRGAGFGRALILACVAYARTAGAQLFWFNARIGALGFYRKLGFEISGGEFEIPDVGPHFRMKLRLQEMVPAQSPAASVGPAGASRSQIASVNQ